MKRRLTIARALVNEPDIVLLDEPTTGLDPTTKRGVVDALLALLAGRTAVIVTHDLELARRADEIFVLVDGRIQSHGTYDELMQSSEIFRELARSLEGEEAAR
jgi:ABC-type multidrug transport system fused ATPase/permease subunit